MMKEIVSTVRMVAILREMHYPISVEVAIPYSDGSYRDTFNPYPDSFFVERIVEAAMLADRCGIPSHLFRVSLKDMVGELSAEKARELIPAILDGLRANNLTTELGLHLHDTGLALPALVESISICQKQNWRINVDTVGGKDTGFVNTVDLITTLDKKGISLGITQKQMQLLKEIENRQEELADDFKAARVPDYFSGEDLRRYAIPGGGEASFVNAAIASGFPALLGLSETESLHVLGLALRAVGKIMGHAFPVTPGFQNKQIAAFNLVTNMCKSSAFQAGQRELIERMIAKELSDEEVKGYFLKNLNPVVAEFLRGEMPAPVHPVVRQQLGYRSGLLTDNLKSLLPKAKDVVRELQREGEIPASEAAFDSSVARALIVGPTQFALRIKDPALFREVHPEGLRNRKEWEHLKVRANEIFLTGVPRREAEIGARAEQHFGTKSKSWSGLVLRRGR